MSISVLAPLTCLIYTATFINTNARTGRCFRRMLYFGGFVVNIFVVQIALVSIAESRVKIAKDCVANIPVFLSSVLLAYIHIIGWLAWVELPLVIAM